ncbi:MAG TPA: bifunctional precorrin-2 dehydrogenase/sirohydrochlorin ferrochelatase [Negativicutes bacterium]|nr:bifunctional precorrin-2 dehydrogenase/sirohydrochlorin ferrochelatase [Negativicutes bacterium]
MDYYPMMVDLRNRPCTVVGGGAVAARKVAALLACGASVTVISPELAPQLQQWTREGRITAFTRPYREGDLAGAFLVMSATDDEQVNKAAAAEAGRCGLLLNVADAPRRGNFIVPAVIEQGPLVITVSTGGASPALAKKIRRELADKFGPEYGIFLTLLAKVRAQVAGGAKTRAERQQLWEDLVNSDLLSLIAEGRIEEAEEKIQRAVNRIGT